MPNILLLGAGFSKNWGGWLASEAFEYLLGCPEISNNSFLRELLWKHQAAGGFESALAAVQMSFTRDPESKPEHLDLMEAAVARMFEDMNAGFFSMPSFEFSQTRGFTLAEFLARFDAIFTLNQDLLLEYHYLDRDISLSSGGRWSASQLPGLVPMASDNAEGNQSWARRTWIPEAKGFQIQYGAQPYFKLHGSSNWKQEVHGMPLMIIGGEKVVDIIDSPLLLVYFRHFEQLLNRADTRLMIIGYGFRDGHINSAIIQAVKHGAKLFNISPEGGMPEAVSRPEGLNLAEALRAGLVGASRRPLSTTFGGDEVEFRKLMRFFNC